MTDFSLSTATLPQTFSGGEIFCLLMITITDDDVFEGGESITITFDSTIPNIVFPNPQVTVVIADNEGKISNSMQVHCI